MKLVDLLIAAALLTAAAVSTTGCAPEGPDEEDPAETEEVASDGAALTPGINGDACMKSPYNCKLRVSGGNRVENAQGGLWAVDDDEVLDGNGDLMVDSTWDHLRFNYGQTRRIGDRTYGFAMSTSNGSSGWFPLDAVTSEKILRDRIGEVNAKAAGLDKMGCYQIRASHDSTLAAKKVVYDTQSDNERAGDYLPLERNNGTRYANLTFNTPGFGLGGVAIDIFPSGTKFRRLDVPTDGNAPSIDVPLWVKDSADRFRKRSGSLKFVYGYVITADGTRRNGWMAYEALRTSDNCP